MSILIASDLHLNGNQPGGDRSFMKMADYICRNGTREDVLMLLGDYGNSEKSIRNCLTFFRSFIGKKLAVIGNHDLWEGAGAPDTTRRYLQVQEIMESMGFHALDRSPAKVGELGFIGNVGWYDYSFGDLADVPIEAYEAKIFPGKKNVCWFDACYVNWRHTDPEVVAMMAGRLEAQLRELDAGRVIVGMHHVPTKRLLFHPRSLVPRAWRFANSFLGSEKFAELFSRMDNRIEHVFCGHIHRFRSLTDRGVRYTSVGSDYGQKMLLVYDALSGRVETKKF